MGTLLSLETIIIVQSPIMARITTVIAALIVVKMGVATFVKFTIVAANLERLAAVVAKPQKAQMKYSHFIVIVVVVVTTMDQGYC